MLTLLAALAPEAARAQDACAAGRVRSEATEGRCCWPGQRWSAPRGRCEGPPSACPSGYAAEGDACVAQVSTASPALTPATWAPQGGEVASGRARADLETTTTSLVWLQVWGVVMWAIVYTTTIGVTAGVGGDAGEIGLSAVPFAGPWLCWSMCDEPDPYVPGLIASGTLQAVSLLMLLVGSVARVEKRTRVARAGQLDLAIAPWLDTRSAGGVLALRF